MPFLIFLSICHFLCATLSHTSKFKWLSVQFSSVAQLCLTLYNPMNRSTPGLPVHHQLPEFTQTHAHRVGDAIQPSHPLSPPSPPAPNPSQHQGLFPMSQLFAQSGQSTGVSASASILPVDTQDWSPLGWTGWISLHDRDNHNGVITDLEPDILECEVKWALGSIEGRTG